MANCVVLYAVHCSKKGSFRVSGIVSPLRVEVLGRGGDEGYFAAHSTVHGWKCLFCGRKRVLRLPSAWR